METREYTSPSEGQAATNFAQRNLKQDKNIMWEDRCIAILVLAITVIMILMAVWTGYVCVAIFRNDNVQQMESSQFIAETIISNKPEEQPKEFKVSIWAEDFKSRIEEYMEMISMNINQNTETRIYEATEEEVIAMARVIDHEARYECFEGKVAVGATIVNRHFSDNPGYAGKSIIELVNQKNQYRQSSASVETLEENGCLEAARAALRGEDPTRETFPETGAMFFFSPNNMSEKALASRSGITVHIIGNHHFHADI